MNTLNVVITKQKEYGHEISIPYSIVTQKFLDCKKDVDIIYNKIRMLISTINTWISNSLSDEITEDVVHSLYISFNKTMTIVSADVEELIITYGVTDRRELFELRDVVVQLQEIADEIFEPYIK